MTLRGRSPRRAAHSPKHSARPGPAPIPPGALRRLIALFRPYRRRLVLLSSVIVVASSLGAAIPLLVRSAFDRALFVPGGVRLGLLYELGAAIAVLTVASGAFSLMQAYLAGWVGQQVMDDLRQQVYAHLQSMSLRFFTATRTGEIQSRLTNDVNGVQGAVTGTATTTLANTVMVTSTMAGMLVISWQLTILSVALVPVFIVISNRVGVAGHRFTGQISVSKAEMSTIAEETLSVSGALLAKTFGRQQDQIRRFAAESRRLGQLQLRQDITAQGFVTVSQSFFSLMPALVYVAGGILIAHGGAHASAGTLVAITALQSRLFFPIGQLLHTSVQVRSSLALFQRIFEYLDLEPDIADAPGARDLPAGVRGTVRFDRVSFRYDQHDDAVPDPGGGRGDPERGGDRDGPERGPRPWALREVTLEIPAGSFAAIVGPSGAGKTTLSYLIPRLYETTSGSVLIDGHDVRDIRGQSLTGLIGMVTQETYLFHATIAENLRYGRPTATGAELRAAAQAAHIHQRITELEHGYDTIVGERGYRLSGGEKQRLAIARVILKDPRILILDEATSALDTASERMVQAALETLVAGRTTIAIAHRLSTIMSADLIVVLDQGRIIEQGTHSALLARGGLYARLCAHQFRAPQDIRDLSAPPAALPAAPPARHGNAVDL